MNKKCVAGLVCSFLFVVAEGAGAVDFTLQDLINYGSGGVTIGNETFYNFGYVSTPVNAANLPATSITAVPVTTLAEPGLDFVAGWSAGPNQSMDSKISYYVTAPSLTPIADVLLQFNGASRSGGSASVTETVYANGPTGALLATLLVNSSGIISLTDTARFLPNTYTTLYVVKDISVSGGPATGGGSAAVSFVVNQFYEVPLPDTLLLLLPGLLGIFGIRKRITK